MGKGSSGSRMLLQVFNLEDWGTRSVGYIPHSWDVGSVYPESKAAGCVSSAVLHNHWTAVRDDKGKHIAAFLWELVCAAPPLPKSSCIDSTNLMKLLLYGCVLFFLIVKEA